VRFHILCGIALGAAASLLLSTGTVRGSGFWWKRKPCVCFPAGSPSFGYTSTTWSPWPVTGRADDSLPAFDGPSTATPSLKMPRLWPNSAPTAPAGTPESPRHPNGPGLP